MSWYRWEKGLERPRPILSRCSIPKNKDDDVGKHTSPPAPRPFRAPSAVSQAKPRSSQGRAGYIAESTRTRPHVPDLTIRAEAGPGALSSQPNHPQKSRKIALDWQGKRASDCRTRLQKRPRDCVPLPKQQRVSLQVPTQEGPGLGFPEGRGFALRRRGSSPATVDAFFEAQESESFD